MSIPTIEELMGMDVIEFDKIPVPIDDYNVVITKAEVKPGAKGPYIAIETTIFEGEYRGRKVWRGACSFSEKAMGMPGGVANLVQSTQAAVPTGTPPEQMPAAIAAAVLSAPVGITTEHDQVVRNGIPATLDDGSPELKALVRLWSPPSDEFVAAVKAEAAGLDDDLPF